MAGRDDIQWTFQLMVSELGRIGLVFLKNVTTDCILNVFPRKNHNFQRKFSPIRFPTPFFFSSLPKELSLMEFLGYF